MSWRPKQKKGKKLSFIRGRKRAGFEHCASCAIRGPWLRERVNLRGWSLKLTAYCKRRRKVITMTDEGCEKWQSAALFTYEKGRTSR